MSRIHNFWVSVSDTDPENRGNCCGCGGCETACPKQAISMQYDSEGFLYPVVNLNNCVDCGKCTKVCPVMNAPEQQKYLHAYAGSSNKPEVIEKCASGGTCTAVSQYVIQNGGVVFGVKYQEDFIKSEYAKAETMEELEGFMTSKYVQSSKKRIYAEVKKELLTERLVAFVGCPCDVSALYLYLGAKYENLVTVELVCMGVTNYKVAEAYIKPRVKKWGELKLFNAKGKKYGWFVPCLEEGYQNGKYISNGYFGTYYGYAFTRFQRPSCAQCQYRGDTGRGDIRTGDFWGIKQSDDFFNPRGVSCIFARTEKGNEILQTLKEDNFSLTEVSYEQASENNNMHTSHNYTEKQYKKREQFIATFMAKGLVAACRENATTEFWIKHYVPMQFANMLKQIRHSVIDKKTK